MTRSTTFAALLALALVTGCATKAPQSAQSTPPAPTHTPAPTSAAAPAPSSASAVELQPVRVPAASAKKLALNMSGSKAILAANDWAAFKEEWRATFADHAKLAGIAFDLQQGEAKPIGEAGTLLTVYVNDYRMVGIGARIFLGVFTGNAYIDAKAIFTDLATGKESFGEQAINTTSSAWSGVFAKMTPQQVDAIATQVFAVLKTP